MPDGSIDLGTLVSESQRLAQADDWGPEALSINRQLVALRPDASGAAFRLAACLDEAGEYNQAIRYYKQALVGPLEPPLHRVAARRVVELGQMEAAAKCNSFSEALARSRELRTAAQPEAALHWLRRAYRLASSKREGAIVLTAAASTLRTLRRFDDAVRTARRAVALDADASSNSFAYAALVAALADSGSVRQACSVGQKLLAANPRDVAALNAAGRALSNLASRTNDEESRRQAAACFATAASLDRSAAGEARRPNLRS